MLAGLGLGGVLLRPALRPAAATSGFVCSLTRKCDAGYCYTCQYLEDGTGCTCSCEKCQKAGIAGGGTVAVEGGGEAHLAMLATRYPMGENVFAVEGQVRWTDPGWEGAGLTLESTVVTYYAPLPDVEDGREVLGTVRSAQRPGEFPFVLRAVAARPGALGSATVALWVGDAIEADPAVAGTFAPAPAPSGFGYAASGTLDAGDLQLLNLAVGAGETTPAP
jgi:hypothetical protein